MKWIIDGINLRRPFNTAKSISFHSLRMDGMNWFACWRAMAPQENEWAKQKWASGLDFGWVSGGTAARQPAKGKDEQPTWVERFHFSRSTTPSQPSTQSPAFLWLSMPSQEKRDWIVDGLSELWNEFVLLILILGGLRAAAAALLRTKEKAIKQNKRNEQWMKPK